MKTYKEINGLTLKIQVSYNKGGMNFFTYEMEKRGYYLSVSPVKREVRDGFVTESYTAFSGIKTLLNEVTRQSDKGYNTALKLSEGKEGELIQYVLGKNNLK